MTHLRTPRLFTLLPLAAALVVALGFAPAAQANGPEHAVAAPAKSIKPAALQPLTKMAAEPDPMDKLRDRLAEKLGAQPAPESKGNVVRVVAKPGAETAAPAKHAAAAKKAAPGHGVAHWDYKGEAGPAAWGGLKAEFSLCGSGKRQSPIDIRDGIAVDLEPVQFDYRAGAFRVIDNGHTVQVNVASGNFINVAGRRWELVQFHFHRPSEERIDGRQFDMVAHLVHKDSDGKLAVVAVLLDRGSIQPIIQTVWNNLPLEKGEESSSRAVIDLNHLLPPDRRYFTYMGSLTTPPCSEGVLWMVMRQPVPVSQEQIDIFARLYPMNARPVQQASGRLIKQSQ